MDLNPRQQRMLEEIRARGAVSVERLAERLGVTLQTVRRDVQRLAEAGLVARFHGGVSVPSKAAAAEAWRQRQHIRTEAKMLIAQAVVDAIPDGASIMLGVGTTIEAVAKELLTRRGIHVVTHSLQVANVLCEHPDCRLQIVGGLIRSRDRGIETVPGRDGLDGLQVDISLVSSVGIDIDGALRDQDCRDQNMLQTMIDSARETWLLVDVSKFYRPAMVEIAHLRQIQHVFTDAVPPPPFPDILQRHGVNLTVADTVRKDPFSLGQEI